MHFDLTYGPIGWFGAILIALLVGVGLIFLFFLVKAAQDVSEEIIVEREDAHSHGGSADVEMEPKHPFREVDAS